MKDPNRDVSAGRKALYYAGLVVTVIGFFVFLSVFFTLAFSFAGPAFGPGMSSLFGSFALRGILGVLMVGAGQFMMRVGARGVAGSGLMLDPRRTREDLEPWSRAAGGMVNDALDEANIDLHHDEDGNELPFDEKLRRLESLRKEGLITEEEYQAKRHDILNDRW